MLDEFMKASMKEAIYIKKEGTATSYYWKEGARLLPNRLSISSNLFSNVQRTGRAVANGLMVGQCKGQFTKKETSPLKVCKPYYITTSIWQHPNYLQFIGYGTLGFSNAEAPKGITDLGDLLVLYSKSSDWGMIHIFYFAGMGQNPTKLEEAMNYACKLVKEERDAMHPLQLDI